MRMNTAGIQRVAIVTGASSGIGRQTAVALARRGFALVIAARRRAELQHTAAMCPSDGLIEVVGADLSDPQQARLLVTRAVERFGRLDVLINNAGLGERKPIAETTAADVDRALRLNALAPASAMIAAWAVFVRQRQADPSSVARIINVSSMASFDPFPGFFAYASSKAAMDMLTLSAAREGEALGIRVLSVNPGAVETDMLRSAFNTSEVPADQTLSPGLVAEVIARAATGEFDAMSGQRIPVLSHSASAWYAQWTLSHRWPAPVVPTTGD
jgi:NAD(P)-dependent dehydrogenase (short-subunit alcohol dehydrogenase family)